MSQISENSNKQISERSKQNCLEFKHAKKRVLKRPTSQNKSSKSHSTSIQGVKNIERLNTFNDYNEWQNIDKQINQDIDYGKLAKCETTRETLSNLTNNYQRNVITRRNSKKDNQCYHLRPTNLTKLFTNKTDRSFKKNLDENKKIYDLNRELSENSKKQIRIKTINNNNNNNSPQFDINLCNSEQIYLSNYKINNQNLSKSVRENSQCCEITRNKQHSNTYGPQFFSYHIRSNSEGQYLNCSIKNANLQVNQKQQAIQYNFSKNVKSKSHYISSFSINQSIECIAPVQNRQFKIEQFQLGFCQAQDIFGKTYSARHIETGFILCIKQIFKRQIRHDIQKLIQCLKIQAFCCNEYIVEIYGFIEQKQKIYILMEYHDQGGLFLKLKSLKGIQPKDSLLYLRNIAQGINHLHTKNIVYRNLKPQSISFFYETCKISNLSWSGRENKQKTNNLGIIQYSSPELLMGNKYSKECDVWGLGVVLFEMIFGETPYQTLSHKRAVHKILNTQIQLPEQLNESVRNLLRRILEKNYSCRITIQSLLQQIQYAIKQLE